jgi:hypothetical protein
MTYRIEHSKSKRDSFGNYRYNIYKDDHLVAIYWHDFRGDEHGIEFLQGPKEDSPVGRMTDFIEGGGPQPLTLSTRAVSYLNRMIREIP